MPIIGKKGKAMSWNYRVVREVIALPSDLEAEEVFTIREVYYDKKDQPELWSTEPCSPQGNGRDDLRSDLTHMLLALEQPVIEMEDLPNGEPV